MHGQQQETTKCMTLVPSQSCLQGEKSMKQIQVITLIRIHNPALTGAVYLLELDAVQCCHEANTSCTPSSDRTGRLESTCERTSHFIMRFGVLLFCDLLLCPDWRLDSAPSRPYFPSRGSCEPHRTKINGLFMQLSETSQVYT